MSCGMHNGLVFRVLDWNREAGIQIPARAVNRCSTYGLYSQHDYKVYAWTIGRMKFGGGVAN